MANKARAALSANLAILSQALEAAAPLNITVGSPTARGVRDVRRMDPTAGRGSEAAYRPVLIQNREQTGEGPLRTLGRNALQYLGASAGIQTKRMREDYELQQAEAGKAYQEQQFDEQRLAGNVFEQIAADALQLESYGNAALDTTAENLRRDAAEAHWQYQNMRDPEMRAGALARLQEIQAKANKTLDDHATQGLQEARTFAREELKDLRRSVNVVQSAFSERKAAAQGIEARLALIGTGEIEANSPEGQAILTEAMETMVKFNDSTGALLSAAGGAIGGGALGSMGGPWGAAAGAAIGAIGAVLSKEGQKLSYSDVLKAFYAQQEALDQFTYGDGQDNPGFLPQLQQSLTEQENFARDKLGIPIDESWRNTRFQFPSRERLPADTKDKRQGVPWAPEQGERTLDDLRNEAYQNIPRRVR